MGFRTTSSPGTVVRAIAPALIFGPAIVGSALGHPDIAAGLVPLVGLALRLGSGAASVRPTPVRPGGSHQRPMVQ